MVPGKVENWVVIIDLKDISITGIPAKALQKMITCFQNNYKARLGKMFVLNASFFIRTVWLMVEAFMDSVTKSKIRLFGEAAPTELTELIHANQRFKDYGGNCDKPEKVWPPEYPKAGNRDEYKTDHVPEEDFKKEILENVRIMPTPALASYVRMNNKGSKKKGIFPRKTFYLKGRIERRDSFNGIIPETTTQETSGNTAIVKSGN
jgi:hypothetical protein